MIYIKVLFFCFKQGLTINLFKTRELKVVEKLVEQIVHALKSC